MLMYLPLVTETLLYCRPPLALSSGHTRSRSTSKLSLIRALIHRHNRRVGHTIDSSFPAAERKLKWQANHERLDCAQSSKTILHFIHY